MSDLTETERQIVKRADALRPLLIPGPLQTAFQEAIRDLSTEDRETMDALIQMHGQVLTSSPEVVKDIQRLSIRIGIYESELIDGEPVHGHLMGYITELNDQAALLMERSDLTAANLAKREPVDAPPQT